jgi:hypothetical protein
MTRTRPKARGSDGLEEGKERAAAHAQDYLKRVADVDFPPLKGKESRSV